MGRQIPCSNPECGHTIECPEASAADEVECPECGTLTKFAPADDQNGAPPEDDTSSFPAVEAPKRSWLCLVLGVLGWLLTGACVVVLLRMHAEGQQERSARKERDGQLLARLVDSAMGHEHDRPENLTEAIRRLQEVENWATGTPYEKEARERRVRLERKQQGRQAFAKARQQIEELVEADRVADALRTLDERPPAEKALMPAEALEELRRSVEQRARGRFEAILSEASEHAAGGRLSEVQRLLDEAGAYRISTIEEYVARRLREWREAATSGPDATPALVAMIQRRPVPADFALPDALRRDFELPNDTRDRWGNEVTRQIHSRTGYPLEIRHRKTGLHLVYIPAGSFQMGSDSGRPEESPVHRVTIAKPFYAGKYEVTVAQFRQFAEATNYQTDAEREGSGYVCVDGRWQQRKDASWRNPHFEQTDAHPVALVTLHDAQVYGQWLNDVSEAQFRVPTEAQWEYVARAGLKAKWFWGGAEGEIARYGNTNDESARAKVASRERINASDGHAQASPVGQFQPNPLGVYDVVGNVWEWCQDVYHPDYYRASPEADPVNLPKPDTSLRRRDLRVMRGGSWAAGPGLARHTYRGRLDHAAADVGSRVIVSLAEEAD